MTRQLGLSKQTVLYYGIPTLCVDTFKGQQCLQCPELPVGGCNLAMVVGISPNGPGTSLRYPCELGLFLNSSC